jgi:hypothetical protein
MCSGRSGMFAVFVLCITHSCFAQSSLNPIGNNGNILSPGTPLTGPSPVTSGPVFGSMASSGSSHSPAVSGIKEPAYGEVHSAAGMVHNPTPREYDPIFGVYNPGTDYQLLDGLYPVTEPAPAVTINQIFQPKAVHPVLQDYTNVPGREPDRDAVEQDGSRPLGAPSARIIRENAHQTIYYLIAMKDHMIYPALAYWIEKDTLTYLTIQGTRNHVSLSLVDRDLSLRLNNDPRLGFTLPPLQ